MEQGIEFFGLDVQDAHSFGADEWCDAVEDAAKLAHHRVRFTRVDARDFDEARVRALFKRCYSRFGASGAQITVWDFNALARELAGKFGLLGELEALFWWFVLTDFRRWKPKRAPEPIFDDALATARKHVGKGYSDDAAYARLRGFTSAQKSTAAWHDCSIITRVLGALLPPSEVIEVWCMDAPVFGRVGMFRELFPPPSEEDEAEVIAFIDSELADERLLHRTFFEYLREAVARAPSPERAQVVLALVFRPHDYYYSDLRGVSDLLFIIRSPELYMKIGRDAFDRDFRRATMQFLDVCGYKNLDRLVRYASEFGRKDDQRVAVSALCELHTPGITAGMVALYRKSYASDLAQGWLVKEGANAIAGLVRLAAARGQRAEAPIELLRYYGRMGCEELIAELAEDAGEAARRVVTRRVLEHHAATHELVEVEQEPEWFLDLMSDKAMRRKKLPKWLQLEVLPRLLTLDDECLNAEHRAWFIRALKESALDAEHEALGRFRAWLDPESAADFVWALFEHWIRAGGKATYKWALWGLGLFGDAGVVNRFGAYLLSWPKQGNSARALWGVEALGAIECPESIVLLFKCEGMWKYRNFRHAALAKLEQIAAARGVDVEVLADQIVPTCGFDSSGERDFDYGPRHFTLRLDETLKPYFWDNERGKSSRSLPRARKTDDPDLVEASRASYKADKKLLEATINHERRRMESALVHRRKWSVQTWYAHIVGHPILRSFAHRLIWCAIDDARDDVVAFQLSEDRSLVTLEDELFVLEEHDQIALLHPAQVTDAQVMKWVERLVDYEIVQPFAQLDRPVVRFEEGQRARGEFAPESGWELDGQSFWQALYRSEWETVRSKPDRDFSNTMIARLDKAGVIARAVFSPGIDDNDHLVSQTITSVQFLAASDVFERRERFWEEHPEEAEYGRRYDILLAPQLDGARVLMGGALDAGICSELLAALVEAVEAW